MITEKMITLNVYGLHFDNPLKSLYEIVNCNNPKMYICT